MQVQRVFQAGNSSVVAIPKDLLKDLKIKPGQKVFVEKSSDGDTIMIKKANRKNIKTASSTDKTALTPEFKKWLDNFMTEYKPILKKLANM